MGQFVRLVCVVASITWAIACGFPRPADVADDGGFNDSGLGSDASSPLCTANQALRCEGDDLARCNGEGTAEIKESCSLGCSATALRCKDVDPSNGLARFLDMTTGEAALDLGATATINTDDGSILVNGGQVVVTSDTLAQPSAPSIRVFIVRSLTATDVDVTGSNALAFVSDGDITIGGIFAASAKLGFPGAGRLNDGSCKGSEGAGHTGARGGAGGGGFGSAGGAGGTGTNDNGAAAGGSGGTVTGNSMLIPLRGGCDSGKNGGAFGKGGGAIQLVSRTKIIVSGVVAANGSSSFGGGSGGGILLEAPIVEVSGAVVANGAGGASGCLTTEGLGEDGRLDATPAAGGQACNINTGRGGNGGALGSDARPGVSVSEPSVAFAGYGGGGVGRIRVNTIPGGRQVTGIFSPSPSTGTIATR